MSDLPPLPEPPHRVLVIATYDGWQPYCTQCTWVSPTTYPTQAEGWDSDVAHGGFDVTVDRIPPSPPPTLPESTPWP